MKVKVEIKGLAEVNKALNSTIAKYPGATLAGLIEIGLKIQRDAQERVPVWLGKLKASAYTRKAIDHPSAVEVGFTAAYAAAVHENVEMKLAGKPRPNRKGHPKGTVYWGPKGEAKFLEKAVRRAEQGLARGLANSVKKRVKK